MRGSGLQVISVVKGPRSRQEDARPARVETGVAKWEFGDMKGLYVRVRVAVNLQEFYEFPRARREVNICAR